MMDRNIPGLDWSDAQWSRVNEVVQETANKTRIAAQILPTTLHPDPSVVAVPDRTLDYVMTASQPPTRRLIVDSSPTTFFTTLAVNVALTSQEASDPELGAALVQFRRAASIVARLEDALLFNGQAGPGVPPPNVASLPPVFDIGGGGFQPGLSAVEGTATFPRLDQDLKADPTPEKLVQGIIDGIGTLEAAGQFGPFASVLDHKLYSLLHEPAESFVLPRDRVTPFLEGPLLRSSTLGPSRGLLLALGSGAMEIVISSELHVRFLQMSAEPRYILRVSERLALRVSDWSAVLVLHT